MDRRLIAALAGALALVAAVLLWRRGGAEVPSVSSPPATAAPVATPPAPAAAIAPPADAPPSAFRARLDAAGRAQLLAQIAAARARRTQAASAPTGAAASAPPASTTDKAYVQARVRELRGQLIACYETTLETAPDVEGTIVVEFTISGEPDIGGLVEDSQVVAAETTITNEAMLACIRDAMYEASFEPPDTGEQVVVRYPFAFSP